MTYITKPKLHHKALPTNALGFTHSDYEGRISTLCAGCGHDSISAALIQACFELSTSSRTASPSFPASAARRRRRTIFWARATASIRVHGRMPSVLTGANLANRDLIYLGVSGDGDTASIGIGQFAHCLRRGVNMVYICENNGVYGLTKGQFSATADKGSKSKTAINHDAPIDLVSMALVLGASFVARGFSGDKPQLVPLLKAALAHKGAAILDVISPCVQFNNTPESTKSYDFVREHNDAVNRIDIIEPRQEITVDYAPGTAREVRQHDGSVLRLAKLDPDYDPHDRAAAMAFLQSHHDKGEIVTGLLYLDPEARDLHDALGTAARPLNQMGEAELCPGAKVLETINASYR